MDVLVTLNKKYQMYLHIMLVSLLEHHLDESIHLYVVSNDISTDDMSWMKERLPYDNIDITVIPYHNDVLDQAKTTYRYPKEIYYRLYAIEYLPKHLDKILYLDTDIIVLKPLKALYDKPFEGAYFIGSSNTKTFLTRFNNWKNKAPKGSKYLNTGVLMIHLKQLREEQDLNVLNRYIIENEHRLFLPDQDVLNALYGKKVGIIDYLKYNLSDRAITRYNWVHLKKIKKAWVDEHAYILHFYGKNKPWKANYHGILKPYFDHYAEPIMAFYEKGEMGENKT